MNNAFLLFVVALSLTGCSSLPEVTYDDASANTTISASEINSVKNTYELWTTTLEFKKDTNGSMSLSVATAPVESNPTILSITGKSAWYKNTAITLTTASDSNLLVSVGTNVTDNRASYITTAGEIIATVATLAGAAPSPPGTPVPAVDYCDSNTLSMPNKPSTISAFDEVINLSTALDDKQDLKCQKKNKPTSFIVGNRSDGVGDLALVTIQPPPPSAVKLEGNSQVLFNSAKNVFLYPACRSATVQYIGTGPVTKTQTKPPTATNTPRTQPAENEHKTADIRKAQQELPDTPEPPEDMQHSVHFLFSDPRYIQAIPLPVKGSLVVKAQCGVTAGADSGTQDATPAIAKALADSLKGIPTGKSSSSKVTKTNATGT